MTGIVNPQPVRWRDMALLGVALFGFLAVWFGPAIWLGGTTGVAWFVGILVALNVIGYRAGRVK